MKRASWIERYVHYTRHLESPENARWWTAATLVAGLLRRQVFIRYPYAPLYPNLYTFIVGPSGEGKKSTIVETGLRLVKDVDSLTLVEQKITAEALLVAMDKNDARLQSQGRFKKDGSVLIFSPELKVFIGSPKNAHNVIAVLTELYGSPDKFPYRTKEHGEYHIANVCPTWLACSTPDWLQYVPADAVDGGFMARVLIIHTPKRGKLAAWPVPDAADIALGHELERHADDISRVEGEYTLEDNAREYFIKWYNNWHGSKPDDEKIHPFYNRVHVFGLKLAMILMADKSDNMSIDLLTIKRALQLIESLVPGIRQALSWIGPEQFGTRDLVRLVGYIHKAGGQISHTDLSRKVRWREITPAVLLQLIRQLEDLGIAQTEWGPPRMYSLIITHNDALQVLGQL